MKISSDMKQAIDTSVKLILTFAGLILAFSILDRYFPGALS